MLWGSILRMVLWSLPDKRYIFSFCLLQILFCFPWNNGTFWRVACISGFGFTLHPSQALSWKAIVPCALGQEALWVARQQRGSERGEGDSAPDQWETHSWVGERMGAGRIKMGPRDSSAWSRHSIFGEALWLLSPPSCPRGHYKMSSRPPSVPHQCPLLHITHSLPGTFYQLWLLLLSRPSSLEWSSRRTGTSVAVSSPYPYYLTPGRYPINIYWMDKQMYQ